LTLSERPEVRRIRADEIEALIPLCIEHAHFERAPSIDTSGLADRLRARIFAEHSPLLAWIAHIDDLIVGYATAANEFSTWSARDYWHVDCLYVVAHMRGQGVGRELMRAVCKEARDQNICELQWQTPEWNVDAQRFYGQLGASMQLKARFTLSVDR
jgi:GNAT superfamily N-acetyltransferase